MLACANSLVAISRLAAAWLENSSTDNDRSEIGVSIAHCSRRAKFGRGSEAFKIKNTPYPWNRYPRFSHIFKPLMMNDNHITHVEYVGVV
jgi:hypothetical protein